MTPIHKASGDQYLHRRSDAYCVAVRRKFDAYHRFIQVGLIMQTALRWLLYKCPQFPELILYDFFELYSHAGRMFAVFKI